MRICLSDIRIRPGFSQGHGEAGRDLDRDGVSCDLSKLCRSNEYEEEGRHEVLPVCCVPMF